MAFEEIIHLTRQAKAAARAAAGLSSPQKNAVLLKAAQHLLASQVRIIEENRKDLRLAEQKGLSKAMIDRLTLDEKRIGDMAQGLREIVELPDPVGQVVKGWTRPNGLRIEKVRIPLGVIGIIYESRPNVT
ncbi:MAG: gamma-glutamyl-phosphate reductase, partial [Deltaproteobacteria bacterium]|nr:gamma-glutamyl-phosphate reductase [Deltaproteobacteria bacterium]